MPSAAARESPKGHNDEMTGTAASDDKTRPDAVASARDHRLRKLARDLIAPRTGERRPAVRGAIWFLEHTQDAVAVTVGIILVALASVLLISGIVDFADGNNGSISAAAPQLLDQVLLVLILVEIVHTVVLSLRAHRLVAQPFIVVGLIAVIRRILLALTPGTKVSVSDAELGLLIGMVAVFVAGLIAVNLFEKHDE
jgi:uncharacterized membrane protein (DUF373 family)